MKTNLVLNLAEIIWIWSPTVIVILNSFRNGICRCTAGMFTTKDGCVSGIIFTSSSFFIYKGGGGH